MFIQLNNVSKYFEVTKIFSDVKFEVNEKDRVAIVGRNGAGKTTLLKVIAGILDFDSGERMIKKNLSLGYLSQEFIVNKDKTVEEEMLSCFTDVINLEKQLKNLANNLTEENLSKGTDLLKRYDILQEQLMNHKNYHYKSRMRTVLFNLDFTEEDLSKKISSFSGGEKTRLSMAKLLLLEPDVLILDEPTNHLDMQSVSWLETYLNSYQGAVVIVSHDRYFLDKIVNVVYNMEFNSCKKYVGNYTKFLEEYEKDYEKRLKDYINQQKDIKKLEEFVSKNIARSSTSGMAKSRKKALDKIQILENPKKDDKTANIEFKIKEESGKDVLRIENLQVGYKNTPIGSIYNFDVFKKDRIAIVGKNGIGKSTLIKTIAKEKSAISGQITYGSKVSIGYYDQKQAEFMSQKTVLNELWDEYETMKESEIRNVLGRFLFTGEEVLKTVSSLSGGQKARLQLAKLMLEKNNLLILDEPTNHLDIASKQVLESALKNYPGTIIFVSHDRYFINKIANKVIELEENSYNIYLGNYDYYLEKKEEKKILKELREKEETKESELTKKTNYEISKEDKKKLRKLVRSRDDIVSKIEETEKKLKEINENLTKKEIYSNPLKANEENEKLKEATEILDDLNEKWFDLENKIEEFDI